MLFILAVLVYERIIGVQLCIIELFGLDWGE